jgi:hypothetical protein
MLELLTSFVRDIDVAREVEASGVSDLDSSEILLKKNALTTLTEYKSRTAEIKSWTVTEDAVLVRTSKYSSLVLIIATAIIGGSLSVPFVVGERIPGVDPFQFVTFGWLIAGAFVVGAKSRYVENWPWHDFLRGQILCRSVSELAVASRVKRQAVLLYLLHHEFRNPLVFRGPYHGIFRRRGTSGKEGFSIDIPVGHATVLAAGFIVLEVRRTRENEKKKHTILLDTREDAEHGALEQYQVFDPLEEVIRGKYENRWLGERQVPRLKLLEGSIVALGAYKVLGIPTADCNFI